MSDYINHHVATITRRADGESILNMEDMAFRLPDGEYKLYTLAQEAATPPEPAPSTLPVSPEPSDEEMNKAWRVRQLRSHPYSDRECPADWGASYKHTFAEGFDSGWRAALAAAPRPEGAER